MEFVLGPIAGFVLTKLAEKLPDKIIDKAIDHGFDLGENTALALFNRIFTKREFNDLLSSEARRTAAVAQLDRLIEVLGNVNSIIDRHYPGYKAFGMERAMMSSLDK